MKLRLSSLICVVALATGAAACGPDPGDAQRDDAITTSEPDSATGTTGIGESADPLPGEPAEPSEGDQAAGQDARAELPATASPLVLTGLAGLLSLAGAAGVRVLRRRSRHDNG